MHYLLSACPRCPGDPKRFRLHFATAWFYFVRGLRSYGQYCGIARALDLVGERWALLVLRELVLGPKRFTDLREGLPGIGRNILAARLRELESAGVVQRK